MTPANNLFSSRRFGNYMTLYLVENRKKLLILLLQIFMALVILIDLMPWLQGVYRKETSSIFIYGDIDPFWPQEFGWLIFSFIVFMGAAGSMTFGAFSAKEKRIVNIMVPASSLEKFISLFLIYTVGVFVCSVILFIAADWIRVLTAHWYALPGFEIKPLPLDFILTSGNSYKFPSVVEEAPLANDTFVTFGTVEMLIAFSVMVIFNAINSLGSIIWRKNAFGKTLGCLFIINSISGYLFYLGFKVFTDGRPTARPFFDSLINSLGPAGFCWIIGTVTILVATFIYYIAYQRFIETDLNDRW